MAAKGWSAAEVAKEIAAEEHLRSIDWSHPDLLKLSDAARLIYAALIDGCSDEARETLIGVDLVWQNRDVYTTSPASDERKGTCEEICHAVRELTEGGLLLLLDDRTIHGGWVRRPWAELPS